MIQFLLIYGMMCWKSIRFGFVVKDDRINIDINQKYYSIYVKGGLLKDFEVLEFEKYVYCLVLYRIWIE